VIGAWLGTEVEDFHYGEVLTFEVLPLVTDRLELRERTRVTNPVAHWTVDDG
jgi:hypothetical protein